MDFVVDLRLQKRVWGVRRGSSLDVLSSISGRGGVARLRTVWWMVVRFAGAC